MNTYRVTVRKARQKRGRSFDVDALRPNKAIDRVLAQYTETEVTNILCSLSATGVALQPQHLHVRKPSR